MGPANKAARPADRTGQQDPRQNQQTGQQDQPTPAAPPKNRKSFWKEPKPGKKSLCTSHVVWTLGVKGCSYDQRSTSSRQRTTGAKEQKQKKHNSKSREIAQEQQQKAKTRTEGAAKHKHQEQIGKSDGAEEQKSIRTVSKSSEAPPPKKHKNFAPKRIRLANFVLKPVLQGDGTPPPASIELRSVHIRRTNTEISLCKTLFAEFGPRRVPRGSSEVEALQRPS